jgi:hypothetical protein
MLLTNPKLHLLVWLPDPVVLVLLEVMPLLLLLLLLLPMLMVYLEVQLWNGWHLLVSLTHLMVLLVTTCSEACLEPLRLVEANHTEDWLELPKHLVVMGFLVVRRWSEVKHQHRGLLHHQQPTRRRAVRAPCAGRMS